jgi:hypothetical protein
MQTIHDTGIRGDVFLLAAALAIVVLCQVDERYRNSR